MASVKNLSKLELLKSAWLRQGILKQKDYLIRPSHFDINAACINVNGLTGDDLSPAPLFTEVLRKFEEDCKPRKKFAVLEDHMPTRWPHFAAGI